MRAGPGILALLVGLFAAGCFFRARPPVVVAPLRQVELFHTHGLDCGHYYERGVWVPIPVGHVHGPLCGHVRVGSVWHLQAVLH